MSIRGDAGRLIEWHDCSYESGFSNFLFVDNNYQSADVVRRLFSIARNHKYQSLIIESIACEDSLQIQADDAALRLRRSDFTFSEVHRLIFLRSARGQEVQPTDCLGFAIIKKNHFRSEPAPRLHVYEAVMLPGRTPEQNNFIHSARTFEVSSTVGTLTVYGALYCQQNDLTFVCAHAALRSAMACMGEEKEISYEQINDTIGIDHRDRLIGDGVGISPEEITSILDQVSLQYEKIVHEPRQEIELANEYQGDVYGAIESGCPALVGFELLDPDCDENRQPRHLIAVIGHTFNEDAWVPNARRHYFGHSIGYFPSESWVSMYVVNDDNFGPYYCLPRHYLSKDHFRLLIGFKKYETAYSSVEAQAIAAEYLSALATAITEIGESWYDRYAIYARRARLVLRPLLLRRDEYFDHLRGLRDRDGSELSKEEVQTAVENMPETIWMIEASAPELFGSSRRKFGEIVLAATEEIPRPLNLSLLRYARFPGLGVSQDQEKIRTHNIGLKGHTNLYSAS